MGAIDASPLSSEQQPLDALRLELQNEPAFGESGMPKDDYTLTFVPFTQYNLLHPFSRPASPCLSQALLEGPWVQCVPGKADDPRLHPLATHRGGRRNRRALPAYRPL